MLDYDLTACSQYQITLPSSCAGGLSYLFVVGTSESAPHVAGAAALVQSVMGGVVAPGRVESCLYESTDRLMPASIFGRGRLNVFSASGCT